MLAWKPEYEKSLERYEAWWEGEIVDRPLFWVTAPKPEGNVPWPAQKRHATLRERWFDAEYTMDCAEASMGHTAYLADAAPIYWPNLGPEVYSAFLGCPLEYTEGTSWAEPILDSWDQLEQIRFDPANAYYRQIAQMTDLAIERAQGRFMVGYTDLHPGADAACSFRDPQRLCMDLVDAPDQVRELLRRVQEPFAGVFDAMARRLEEAGHPVASWAPVFAKGRIHIPSNDFSCMVSREMMEEFFLEITREECRMVDRSIYHLDGRDAIQHLDMLLEIPELDAIQPVISAGDTFDEEWMGVFRRTRAAGKSIQFAWNWEAYSAIMKELPPEGMLFIAGAGSVEEAEAMVRRIERWEG